MIECVVQGADILGEIPLWCERTQLLWWIDGKRPALQSYDPANGSYRAIRLSEKLVIGSIALTEEGDFLLAANQEIYRFDPNSKKPPTLLFDLSGQEANNRLNDGRCDPAGRFWVGSMPADTRREATGNLYRVDTLTTCCNVLDQVMLPNSLSWSPDGRKMYFAETLLRVTYVFDFDIDSGEISNRLVFKDWSDQNGMPDGAAVDQDGCLWTAVLGAGQIVRLTPEGRTDRVIQMPIRNPTCPTFGGSGLDTLFVTSHSQRYRAEHLALEPLAGSLFALNPGTVGFAENRFRGVL